MRLIPISDLHLDFFRSHKHSYKNPLLFSSEGIRNFFSPILKDNDINVICVSGDLAERCKGVVWCYRAARVLNEIAPTTVIYVPGNHEFYGGNMDLLTDDFNEINRTSSDFVHILDGVVCPTHVIDNVTFIGGTLWTDFKGGEAAEYAKKRMNDFRYITSGGDNKLLTPNRIINEHYTQKKIIFKNLEKCETEHSVVLTHHQPFVEDSIVDMLSYAYCTDLTEEFENCTKLPMFWFSGHTHKSHYKEKQFKNGMVTFVANSVGYGSETNTGYNKQCFFDI